MTKGFHAEPTGNTVNMNCRIRQNKDRPDLYPSSEYQVRWYWKQSIACCSEDTKPPNVSGIIYTVLTIQWNLRFMVPVYLIN